MNMKVNIVRVIIRFSGRLIFMRVYHKLATPLIYRITRLYFKAFGIYWAEL